MSRAAERAGAGRRACHAQTFQCLCAWKLCIISCTVASESKEVSARVSQGCTSVSRVV